MFTVRKNNILKEIIMIGISLKGCRVIGIAPMSSKLKNKAKVKIKLRR